MSDNAKYNRLLDVRDHVVTNRLGGDMYNDLVAILEQSIRDFPPREWPQTETVRASAAGRTAARAWPTPRAGSAQSARSQPAMAGHGQVHAPAQPARAPAADQHPRQ